MNIARLTQRLEARIRKSLRAHRNLRELEERLPSGLGKMDMTLWLVPRCILFTLLFVLAAPFLFAQEDHTRFEFGAQYSTIRLTSHDFGASNYSGFGGRFDWNLSRRLAFESQVDFFPEHLIPLVTLQGGQTLQAVFGVRAKVLETRRLAVFGLIRPGLFHFTDAEYLLPSAPTGFGLRPETLFVLNLGGGLEYYVSPRWALRADIEGDPYRAPNSSVALPGSGNLFRQGKIDD